LKKLDKQKSNWRICQKAKTAVNLNNGYKNR
ncbi:hypothetical protein D046_4543B, partial [Vibrio parahaemolyticus V-223/04]